MTSTAELKGEYDLTRVPMIVQGAVKLGLLESILVLLFSLASRFLGGLAELIVGGVILLAGSRRRHHAAGTLDPAADHRGHRGSGRNRSGSRGSFPPGGRRAAAEHRHLQPTAGMRSGVGATGGTTRSGGWWARSSRGWAPGSSPTRPCRDGRPAPLVGFLTAVGAAVVLAAAAVLLGFPGARWTFATFGVAFLPGLALATVLSAMGKRRP